MFTGSGKLVGVRSAPGIPRGWCVVLYFVRRCGIWVHAASSVRGKPRGKGVDGRYARQLVPRAFKVSVPPLWLIGTAFDVEAQLQTIPAGRVACAASLR